MAVPFLVPGLAVAAAITAAATWWARRRRRSGHDPLLRDLEFVAIDTETTGLDPRKDALVALAAVPFVAGQPDLGSAYATLVNPGRPIPATAQAIHGISDAQAREAPPAEAALPAFLAACDRRPVVAHTASFDLTLVNRAARAAGLGRIRGPVLDIGALAHAVLPSWWDLSLEGLGRLTETEPIDRHTARGDALTAGLIFVRLIPIMERHGITTLGAALRLERRAALIPGGPGATGGGLAGP